MVGGVKIFFKHGHIIQALHPVTIGHVTPLVLGVVVQRVHILQIVVQPVYCTFRVIQSYPERMDDAQVGQSHHLTTVHVYSYKARL